MRRVSERRGSSSHRAAGARGRQHRPPTDHAGADVPAIRRGLQHRNQGGIDGIVWSRGATPLAANLRDHTERDRAQELGCRWFTGPFHGTPKLVPGRKVPTGELRRIASIVRLRPESASLEQVVEVIEQDLGLSVKLLRYLNSAYFGLASRVSSVHDAALRLGSRNVARWALTIAIAGPPNISRHLAVVP